MLDINTRWTEDERKKFIYGLQQYGSDWNRIARIIDSKTVQEVYEFASLHYKTMMTGKDLRSLEMMKNSVSLLSEQIRNEHLGGSVKVFDSTIDKIDSNTTIERPTQNENAQDTNTVLYYDSSRSQGVPSSNPVTSTAKLHLPQPNKYEDKIKDLSDADIKLLLRKRLLDMQERRQESMMKRLNHESFANQQVIAFQAKHGGAHGSTKRSRTVEIAPRRNDESNKRSKKRRQSKADVFAGVNALAMVSCAELQKYNHQDNIYQDENEHGDEHRSLQTPGSKQCSVPWDFSIAPRGADKVAHDQSKRVKWSTDEHNQFLAGVEKHGRKWKKIQELVPSKSRDQVRAHAYAHFAKSPGSNSTSNQQGDVLELAGFLSSLSQVPPDDNAGDNEGTVK